MKFSLISRVKDAYAMVFAFFKCIALNKTLDFIAEGAGRKIQNLTYMRPHKITMVNQLR